VEGYKSKRQAFFKIAKCRNRLVQNARNPMSVQSLSWLDLKMFITVVTAERRNRHTTAQSVGLGTATVVVPAAAAFWLRALGRRVHCSQYRRPATAILAATAAKWTPSATAASTPTRRR